MTQPHHQRQEAYKSTHRIRVDLPADIQEWIRETYPELLNPGKGLEGITGKTVTDILRAIKNASIPTTDIEE